MLLSSASYMFFTMLSRISGFIREVLLARYLGVGMESDAFFAAWRIPNSFRKLKKLVKLLKIQNFICEQTIKGHTKSYYIHFCPIQGL